VASGAEVEERLQPVRNWSRKDCRAQIFRELQIDIHETASIADGSVEESATR
jgi:hypothetical protein